jgi:hypothetical protein
MVNEPGMGKAHYWVNTLRLVAEELRDPLRDCKKFDHGKRARYGESSLQGGITGWRLVAEELRDPLRDCKKFDHGKRARYGEKLITR